MRKFFVITIFVSILVFLLPNTKKLYSQNSQTAIEIINSYGHNNELGQYLEKNIKKKIKEFYPDIDILTYNANLEKVKNINTAKSKLSAILDAGRKDKSVLIFIGEEAWMVYRSLYYSSDAKIIVCAQNDIISSDYEYFLKNGTIPNTMRISLDSSLINYNGVGISIQNTIKENIYLIKQLIPSVSNYIYLSEQSYSDYINIGILENLIDKEQKSNLITAQLQQIDKRQIYKILPTLNKQHSVIIINNFHIEPYLSSEQLSLPLIFLNPNEQRNLFFSSVHENIGEYSSKIAQIAGSMYYGKPITEYMSKKPVIDAFINGKTADRLGIMIPDINKNNVIQKPESKTKSIIVNSFVVILILAILIFLTYLYLIIKKRRKTIYKSLSTYSDLFNSYNAIYNSSTVGFALFDKNGEIAENNREYEKLMWPMASIGKPIRKIKLEEINFIDSESLTTLKSGKPVIQTYISDINNNTINYRLMLLPLQDQYLFIIWDNTRTYLDHLDKERMQQIFNDGISYSGINIAEINLTTGEIFADAGWYKHLGQDKGCILNDCFKHLREEDKKVITEIIDALRNDLQDDFSKDIQILNPNGSSHWYNLSFKDKKLNDSNEEICICALIDINSKKEFEQNITASTNKLLSLSKYKNSSIVNMSHSIRTSLNAIVGFSELIIESHNISEKKESLKYIEENNEKLLNLISDIINLVNIKTGSSSLTMSDLDLNKFITEIANEAYLKTDPAKVKIIVKGDDNCIVYTDKDKLKTALDKILYNSIKYTDNGVITLSYKNADTSFCIEIADTGCGISNKEIEKLFNTEIDDLNSDSLSEGLGLPIAVSIIKLLKGTIDCKSKMGQGTAITITLPAKDAKLESTIGIKEKLEKASSNSIQSSNMKTILIAEDNENNYQLLNYILKKKYNILHAVNGEEAVRIFKESSPDLILMDIKMPVLDGYGATAAIRKISKEIPIIAVTAYTFDKDKEKVMANEFSGYISKPVSETELMNAINSFLNEKTIDYDYSTSK